MLPRKWKLTPPVGHAKPEAVDPERELPPSDDGPSEIEVKIRNFYPDQPLSQWAQDATNYHRRATQEFISNLDFYFRQRNRAEILYRIEVKLLAKDHLKEKRIGIWPDNIAFPDELISKV